MSWFNWTRNRGKTVDAVGQIEANLQDLQDGRGRPDLDGVVRPMAPGAKGFITVLALTAILLIGLLVMRLTRVEDPAKHNTAGLRAKIENTLPQLKLALPPPADSPAPQAEPNPGPVVPDLARVTTPGTKAPLATLLVDPIEERRLAAGLQSKDGRRESSSSQAQASEKSSSQDSGPMAERLRPLRLNAAHAAFVGNRDLLLTQGAMIDCGQQTKFVSAQAGMLTCYATRDVRSTSGRVVLIDAGTKFIGYQQGVLAQGQPRIGIVWSRLETPQGVVVHLDSPGTGPLGEAGLDGEIDTHFAERFGGAIMVSLIGDVGSWLSNRGSNGNSGSIRFDNSSDAAQQAMTTVLDNTINIPPTLYRNQGGRIGIYVARDLDFSSVYTLRPAPTAAAGATRAVR